MAEPFAVPDPATLAPPNLERTFSVEELARHDGTDPALPILVAIKGLVYDVTRKRDSYGPGAGYHVFAGKDASCVCVEQALGRSSLKAEDVHADYSVLTAEERKVLDDWVVFFGKRYNVVGRVVSG